MTEAISIVEQVPEAVATKKIGLIGGLALRAGVFYYEQIVKRTAAEKRKLKLVLSHADLNTVLAFVGGGIGRGWGDTWARSPTSCSMPAPTLWR